MKKVIQNNKKSQYIIYSTIIISILNLILITYSNNTYADESSNLDYAITVEPSLNVTTSAQDISLNLNPANHPFDTKDLAVSVGTNNETGYKLILSTIDNTTNLVEQNDNNLYIETLSSETDQANFPGNRWGYKLDATNTNYLPFIPNILISSSDKPTPTIITNTLSFAAKANYNTKAGTYNLALNFQATANPHIYYIQDFTREMCANYATDSAATVIDQRDDWEYTVRWIDNGCWMTKNLNLAGGTKLYSETSNVPDGYLESDNKPFYTLPASSLVGFSNDSTAYVYNSENGDGYYSWPAATAGTAPTSAGTAAPSDICPKGWRLPTLAEITSLINLYSTASALNGDPFFGVYAGFGSHDKIEAYGKYAYYWSGTAGPASGGNSGERLRAYTLYYGDSFLERYNGIRTFGGNIRCIRGN